MKKTAILSILLFIFVSPNLSSKYKLTITSTSPVALDTKIWFNAEIFPGENKHYNFYWKDDTGNQEKIVTEGPKSNWSMVYPSSAYSSSTGVRKVTVKVSNSDKFSYFATLAEGSLTFILKEQISGIIDVTQTNITGIKSGCISTLNATNITTILHDPFDWIKDRTEMGTLYYTMINKDTGSHMVIGPCMSPSILVNITESGRYIIEATVILSLSSHPTTPAPTTTTTTTTQRTTTLPITTTPVINSSLHSSNNRSLIPVLKKGDSPFPGYECGGKWLTQSSPEKGSETKYIFVYVSVTAAEPLSAMNLTGNTWLQHGVMLQLNINCNGTGPYSYCFNITHGAFNESDPKICTHQRVDSNVCDFAIEYYLQKNGTYSLVIAMDNDVSSRIERHAIHVYNTDKEKQLTYIIVPMTCAIIAIVMIIFGIARYIQNKNRYSIEVADFDFGVSDEHVYKPFLQQLREAIASSCTAHFEDHPKRRYIERPQILEDD